MDRRFEYNSIFAPHIRDFIKMRQGYGHLCLRLQWILLEFDRFFVEMGTTDLYITGDLIDKWRSTRVNDSESTLYAKYSAWSQFTRYMCNIGQDCHIPRIPKNHGKNNFTPYIFSHKEIGAIFRECDALRLYDRRMSTNLFIIPTIVRLLYGTGIRVSEALSLRNGDVDLGSGTLTLRRTKNGEQRLVPLSGTLQQVIEQYLGMRDGMPLSNVDDPKGYLFISPNGSHCRSGSVYNWFRKALANCGIQHIGNHHGPRVHDLRHTFAVHSLIKLEKSGHDLYHSLPILSTYLGHRSIGSTEQYVRLTQEMYPELLNDQRKICSYVFPKTKILEP